MASLLDVKNSPNISETFKAKYSFDGILKFSGFLIRYLSIKAE